MAEPPETSALKVLIVDDQPAVCAALELLFELHGLATLCATTPEEALSLVASEDIGAVVQDMNFERGATSGAEGLALLRAIKRLDPDLPVLVVTAFTSLAAAVELTKAGASDYLAKPWDDEKLAATVKNLVRLRSLSQENIRLRASTGRARLELARSHDLCGIVYRSAAMQELVRLAVKIAPADVPVLITGPNGSGKDRIAQIVQASSRRRGGPWITVNAGGLPDELLEAELFGAEAGAFTGARKLRVGRFEEAHGGTLFLDEIGNLSPAGQMKLLRVLQTGELQRLGDNRTHRVDVRILSATNANLPERIAEGTFREDLYFRLNVIELAVPALRDRPEDIEPLAEHFLASHPSPEDGATRALSAAALRALVDHDWPGNVRELENRIQRGVLVARGSTIEPADLGLDDGAPGRRSAPSAPNPGLGSRDEARLRAESPLAPRARPKQEPPRAAEERSHEQAPRERAEIERALVEHRGVVARAAAHLGMSRQALYRRLDRLGIRVERYLKSE